MLATLAFGLYLFAVNGIIRTVGGGQPHWLSPRHLGPKSEALLVFGKHLVHHAWRGEDRDTKDAVRDAAVRNGFPVHLALRVAAAESSLRPHAISATGAMGVMQLMPATARELGVLDPFDPVQGADGGIRYLVALRKRYAGDHRRMLAAYNAGMGVIPREGPLTMPAETSRYVARILGPM